MESIDSALDCRSLEGRFYRLLHDETQYVIYARDSSKPHTDAAPKYDKYDDQYFTVQAGAGIRTGLVLFISKATRKVLYSRSSDPYVDQAGGGGQYDDNWFKLERHPNDPAKFRLRTPSNNLMVYVRLGSGRVLKNTSQGSVSDAGQWWSFLDDYARVEGTTDKGEASTAA